MALRQAGSAFVYILIAVALFAALLFFFIRSAQTGQGNLTRHQVGMYAQEIIDYGIAIERAVDKLRRNGCSEREISFQDPLRATYSNYFYQSTRPECLVHGPQGGNIPWRPFDHVLYTQAEIAAGRCPGAGGGHASHRTANAPNAISAYAFTDVGTTCNEGRCTDIHLEFRFIKQEICVEINRRLGIISIPSFGVDNSGRFFGGGYNQLVTDAPRFISNFPQLNGRTSGCFNGMGPTYYQVVIAR